jgi:SAM-dependent methyltransferase
MQSLSGADATPGDASFDGYYYAHCCGRPYSRDAGWLKFFDGIARRIVEDVNPRRVLDAGCALGLLVETLRNRNVDAFGVDLSSFAIDRVHESVRPFCWRGSVADAFTDDYDLIVCIEVLEHMPQLQAEAAIANFCRHTGNVLFSSSPLDYREATHVNVHPPEYWAEQFARHGFFRDVDFDASFVTSWAVMFRKGAPALPRLVSGYERRFAELSLERNELRASVNELQEVVKRLEQSELQLSQARDRISHMERSFFWKLRGVWSRLAGR